MEKVDKTLVSLRALRRKYFALKRNQKFLSECVLIASEQKGFDFKKLFYVFADKTPNEHYPIYFKSFCEYCQKAIDLMHLYNREHCRNIFTINITDIIPTLEKVLHKKANKININDITNEFILINILPKVTRCEHHLVEFVNFNEVYKTLLTPECHILAIQDEFEDAYFKADYAIKAKKSFDLGIDVKIGVVFGFKNVIPFIKARINELLEN